MLFCNYACLEQASTGAYSRGGGLICKNDFLGGGLVEGGSFERGGLFETLRYIITARSSIINLFTFMTLLSQASFTLSKILLDLNAYFCRMLSLVSERAPHTTLACFK